MQLCPNLSQDHGICSWTSDINAKSFQNYDYALIRQEMRVILEASTSKKEQAKCAQASQSYGQTHVKLP